MAAGWDVQRMLIQMLVHGCYGLGVGILVQALPKNAKRERSDVSTDAIRRPDRRRP